MFMLLLQPKYYDGDYNKMLKILIGCKDTGCTFLVGGRNVDGAFKVVCIRKDHFKFKHSCFSSSMITRLLYGSTGSWRSWYSRRTKRHVHLHSGWEVSHGYIIHWDKKKKWAINIFTAEGTNMTLKHYKRWE